MGNNKKLRKSLNFLGFIEKFWKNLQILKTKVFEEHIYWMLKLYCKTLRWYNSGVQFRVGFDTGLANKTLIKSLT